MSCPTQTAPRTLNEMFAMKVDGSVRWRQVCSWSNGQKNYKLLKGFVKDCFVAAIISPPEGNPWSLLTANGPGAKGERISLLISLKQRFPS